MAEEPKRGPQGGRPPRPKRPQGPPRRGAQGGDRRDWGDRREGPGELWLFGIHAVNDALANPKRVKHRLVVTPNALIRLEESVAKAGVEPEVQDPRKFSVPIDPASVHQGAAMHVDPLDWGDIDTLCAPVTTKDLPRVLLLDRVTDPHNVGAILRSAEVFGARAVIAPQRHSAPESGALAKAASGALERQPYLRVTNLARAMARLREHGYVLIGLDGEAEIDLADAAGAGKSAPLGLALGAEGPGLRQLTKESCDALAKIPSAAEFASLNVSNAAAVALFATRAGG
ncbi:MAG: 23S rRNA (guanosine(2251)-2'-O)-methyltransferase RlmB [Rhodobacteraceae bacterium]|nr:23S rRNA (guanosine(2251)-2'-O)-methyltransferase RlmB [Paracoccaceae bacterium]